MLDWLIIGGGLQGTYFSLYFTAERGIARDKVRVLDPYPMPLERWNRVTANIDMDFLRSAGIHHIGLTQDALYRYAGITAHSRDERFSEPYKRPAYPLFQQFHADLIHEHGLDKLRIQGYARDLEPVAGGWRVETDQGVIETKRVLLAIGRTHLNIPEWAKALHTSDVPLNHVFDESLKRAELPDWEHAVVIGGGITAGQVALSMSKQCPGSVTLMMRHPMRESYFDSSPCWLIMRCRGMLVREKNYDKRRDIVNTARQRGAMSPDIARYVRQAAREQRLHLCEDEVIKAEQIGHSMIRLELRSGNTVESDRVILGTGFDASRPGGEWLDNVINRLGLPVGGCGFPVVGHKLEWVPGLHVIGALAELEIGPASPNIIGARLAAARIGLAT